jgi:hypothetical protein
LLLVCILFRRRLPLTSGVAAWTPSPPSISRVTALGLLVWFVVGLFWIFRCGLWSLFVSVPFTTITVVTRAFIAALVALTTTLASAALVATASAAAIPTAALCTAVAGFTTIR